MTREEALEMLRDWWDMHCTDNTAKAHYEALRTYILDSIPAPTVEVVNGMNERELYVTINGELCHDQPFYLMRKAESQRDALVAALGIEVKP